MSITADVYRSALRRHPAGVAIITLRSTTGPVGFTATSLTSLSLDPPLVCFNITHSSSSIDALNDASTVIVHILGQHQVALARNFSRKAELRFADPTTWTTLRTGEPILNGTPTWLRLAVRSRIPAGDSTLVVGEVIDVHCDNRNGGTPAPLIYHDGSFVAATTTVNGDG